MLCKLFRLTDKTEHSAGTNLSELRGQQDKVTTQKLETISQFTRQLSICEKHGYSKGLSME